MMLRLSLLEYDIFTTVVMTVSFVIAVFEFLVVFLFFVLSVFLYSIFLWLRAQGLTWN